MGCLFGKGSKSSDLNEKLENLENSQNINNLINIENIENIDIPSIPINIIEMFKKDWKFIIKHLEYKRDATLSLLKINNTIINIYDDNFKIKFEKEIKTKSEFLDLIKKYAKIFILEGLKFYNNKDKNNNIQLINEKFLDPIVKKLFYRIYTDYLKKITFSSDEQGKQNDCINLELIDKTDINNFRYYYNFQGVISVEHTNYGKSKNDFSFKIEFNGYPKFEIVICDLNKLKILEKNENILKGYIDKIDEKIVEQNLKNFDL